MEKRRSRSAAQRAALLALSALTLLTGCGNLGNRETAAGSVATKLLTAVAAKDGAAACATLAPDTADELVQSEGKSCDKAILDQDLPSPATVRGADVYGQWAQVRLTDDTVFLAVFPGGWRVVAAGCTHRKSRPYDCALQEG